jgi:amino acid adenylation domain-containing protein
LQSQFIKKVQNLYFFLCNQFQIENLGIRRIYRNPLARKIFLDQQRIQIRLEHFLQLLYHISQENPNSIALESFQKGNFYTYAEMICISENIAFHIQEKFDGFENLIGIILEPSPLFIICMLAIWMSGNAYIPIDVNLPSERLKFQLEDSNCSLVLLSSTTCNMGFDLNRIPHWVLEEDFYTRKSISLIKENSRFQIHNKNIYNYKPTISPLHTMAYIVYTSGTTGNPKGVIVEHTGIVNFLKAQIKVFRVNQKSRIYSFLSPGFDAFLSEVGISLLSGGTLFFGNPEWKNKIPLLLDIWEEKKITHVCIPPSLLNILSPSQKPSHLETFIIGGEVTPISTIQRWCNEVHLVNVYGPTEATVCTHLIQCDSTWEKNYIGYPIDGILEWIIPYSEQTANKGELCLGGNSLCRGYLHRPSLDEEKFFFIGKIRYYKTGDLVERTSDGKLVYLGRIDRQVKIRGNRTELEEIESAMDKIHFIRKSIVLLVQEPTPQLLAFYISESFSSQYLEKFLMEQDTNEIQEIRESLKINLPEWMLPDLYFRVPFFPLNSNKKIDLHQLLEEYKVFSVPEKKTSELKEDWEIALKLVLGSKISSYKSYKISDLNSIERINLDLHLESKGLFLLSEAQDTKIGDLSLNHFSYHEKIYNKENLISILSQYSKEKQDFIVKQKTKGKNFFLTGSTGFFGKYVLRELLKQTASVVYCLHRNSEFEFWKEISKEIPRDLFFRIRPIRGDLQVLNWGLGEKEWEMILESIKSIYYIAGNTNSYLSLENLEINFKPIWFLSEICKKNPHLKIHYASSLASLILSNLPNIRLEEVSYSHQMSSWKGGYSASKYAGEFILENSNIPFMIYRIGLLGGSLETGILNQKDLFTLFLKGASLWKKLIPNSQLNPTMDWIPVDFAAKVLVQMSMEDTNSKYIHICNPQPISLECLQKSYENLSQKLSKQPDERAISYINYLQNTLESSILKKNSRQLFLRTDLDFSCGSWIEKFTFPVWNEKILAKYLENLSQG